MSMLHFPIWFSYYHHHYSNKYFSNFRVYFFMLQVLFRSLDDRTEYSENRLMEWDLRVWSDPRVWVHFEIQPLRYFHISWKWLLLAFISVMIWFADWVHRLIGILQKLIRVGILQKLIRVPGKFLVSYFHISWKIFFIWLGYIILASRSIILLLHISFQICNLLCCLHPLCVD